MWHKCGTALNPKIRMNTEVWHCGTRGTQNTPPIYTDIYFFVYRFLENIYISLYIEKLIFLCHSATTRKIWLKHWIFL